jgi:DNA (cytosine-5)-methyltransferase 1
MTTRDWLDDPDLASEQRRTHYEALTPVETRGPQGGFTFVDLFAGIGGFHAALTEMGGDCVLAVEKDEQAALVYEDNWGMDPRGDVTDSGWMDKLPAGQKVDVICGGFPCQPFSKGGAQLGMSEARGTLFYDICLAIKRWQPAVVMLENVRNLTGPKHTHTWEVVISSLRELGYRVSSTPVILSPHWIAPEDGGTPQNRERVYILATKVGAEAAAEEVLPTIQLKKWAGTWQLEEDLPLQLDKDLGDELKELKWTRAEEFWVIAWEDLVIRLARLRAQGMEGDVPRFPIWVDSWNCSSLGAPAWKRTIEAKNQAWYELHQEMLDDWVSRWDVLSFPGSRRKLEWQAQVAESMEHCLVQFRPSGLRVKRATHAGALVAIDQRPFVVARGRRLSARECARLQGFPEWFSFDAAPRWAYKQTGNAVHVGSVKYALRAHVLAPETRAALGVDHPLVEAVMGAYRAALLGA